MFSSLIDNHQAGLPKNLVRHRHVIQVLTGPAWCSSKRVRHGVVVKAAEVFPRLGAISTPNAMQGLTVAPSCAARAVHRD